MQGQLLGDGRDGSVWSLLRDPLRSHRRPVCCSIGQHGQSQCAGAVEFSLHGVQQVCTFVCVCVYVLYVCVCAFDMPYDGSQFGGGMLFY